ncbi:hypothetical protein U1Q18_007202 [Sarracenia purpurea var. burkii]
MYRRPRKRPRLGWDVAPQTPKIRSTAKWVKVPLDRTFSINPTSDSLIWTHLISASAELLI